MHMCVCMYLYIHRAMFTDRLPFIGQCAEHLTHTDPGPLIKARMQASYPVLAVLRIRRGE